MQLSPGDRGEQEPAPAADVSLSFGEETQMLGSVAGDGEGQYRLTEGGRSGEERSSLVELQRQEKAGGSAKEGGVEQSVDPLPASSVKHLDCAPEISGEETQMVGSVAGAGEDRGPDVLQRQEMEDRRATEDGVGSGEPQPASTRRLPASLLPSAGLEQSGDTRTFAAVLQGTTGKQDGPEVLRRKQGQQKFQFANCSVSDYEGSPAVKFLKTEWRKMAEKEGFTLVGKFGQGRPPIDRIRASFQKSLLVQCSAHIGALDSRHILLRFSSREDCDRIALRGQMKVEGKLVRFLRWSPDWFR